MKGFQKTFFKLLLALLLTTCNDDPIRELVISSFTPTSEGPGNEVLIVGRGFGLEVENVILDFNGAVANVLSVSDTVLIAEVPVDATNGPINVQVVDQRIGSNDDFIVFAGIWNRKTEIPTEVGFGAAIGCTFNGKAYAGTGGDNGQVLANFWEYDPEIDQWSALPSIPVAPDVLVQGLRSMIKSILD